MHYIINNLTIVTSNKIINNGFIEIIKDKIVNVGLNSEININNLSCEIYDGKHLKVFPGFIDPHIHGGYGVDFESNDINKYEHFARELPKEGVTSFLFTSVSNSIEKLNELMETFKNFFNKQNNKTIKDFSKCIGIHLEGPFISKQKSGAHDNSFLLKPNIEILEKINQKSGNNIKLITYDIEQDYDNSFIKYLNSNNILGSVGHCNCNSKYYHQYNKDKEINQATHLYNAMSGLKNRECGVAAAILNDDDCYSELIIDKHHVEDELVKLTFKIKGSEKIILTTDSISAKGLNNGLYNLGTLEVEKKDEICVLKDSNILAGSVAKFIDCFKNAKEICNLTDIDLLNISSKNIAKQLKVDHLIGDIRIDMYADLVFLDSNYDIKMTIINGTIVYIKKD